QKVYPKLTSMMKVIFLLFLASAACIGAAQTGQNAPDRSSQSPTIDHVLQRYVEALGGRVAIEQVMSRAAKGTFTSSSLKTKGPIEVYAKAPNRQLMVLLAAGYGNYRRGFDGNKAWELYPGGARSKPFAGFAKRDAEFYLPVRFLELFPNASVKGTDKLNEH